MTPVGAVDGGAVDVGAVDVGAEDGALDGSADEEPGCITVRHAPCRSPRPASVLRRLDDRVVAPPRRNRLICLDELDAASATVVVDGLRRCSHAQLTLVYPAQHRQRSRVLLALAEEAGVRAQVQVALSESAGEYPALVDGSDLVLSPHGSTVAATCAMWRARPFVGALSPALVELLPVGSPLVPEGDSRALAEAVRGCLASPFGLLAMGWTGRRRIETLRELHAERAARHAEHRA